MKEPIIEIKNLGKKYNITHQRGGYIALRDVIAGIIKSPFSFIKAKTKKIAGLETKEEFWALKGVNLEIKKGEIVGIIGSNGAGKSTLLKILSQITPPTTGEIKIRGSVGSLLEVGTGFHPELTGRENIFLNGAILGMTRKDIAAKFDQIVEFAGIEKFLDTPVKYYSSGMYVRLAFSVAAHMESDILIVDEVLAVGDAEFQKKCLGKMEEITKTENRTILFVSHNLPAIQTLCTRAVLLKEGTIIDSGDTAKVIAAYFTNIISPRLSNLTEVSAKDRMKRSHGNKALFSKAIATDGEGKEKKIWDFRYDENINFEIECKVKEPCDGLTLLVRITDIKSGLQIGNFKRLITSENLSEGKVISYKAIIPKETIRSGQYSVSMALGNANATFWYDIIDHNVNLPTLVIHAVNDDPHDNSGFVTIPCIIENVKIS